MPIQVRINTVVRLVFTSMVFAIGLMSFAARAAVEVRIQDKSAIVVIELAGGLEADLLLNFENALGLSAQNLNISAEIINPLDPQWLWRLPHGVKTLIPNLFPVLITIEPRADRGFSFSGVATIDIHTHNLEYIPNTPLRLYKAPLGGAFRDITITTGAGSYRARGSLGSFSQFLIVADIRLPSVVVNEKIQAMRSELNSASSILPLTLFTELQASLNIIESRYLQSQIAGALSELDKFTFMLQSHRGDAIPDVWRSSRDIRNIFGELSALSQSLRYSLNLQR